MYVWRILSDIMNITYGRIEMCMSLLIIDCDMV